MYVRENDTDRLGWNAMHSVLGVAVEMPGVGRNRLHTKCATHEIAYHVWRSLQRRPSSRGGLQTLEASLSMQQWMEASRLQHIRAGPPIPPKSQVGYAQQPY